MNRVIAAGLLGVIFLATGCGEHPPEVKAEYGKKCRARLERTFHGAEMQILKESMKVGMRLLLLPLERLGLR